MADWGSGGGESSVSNRHEGRVSDRPDGRMSKKGDSKLHRRLNAGLRKTLYRMSGEWRGLSSGVLLSSGVPEGNTR